MYSQQQAVIHDFETLQNLYTSSQVTTVVTQPLMPFCIEKPLATAGQTFTNWIPNYYQSGHKGQYCSNCMHTVVLHVGAAAGR